MYHSHPIVWANDIQLYFITDGFRGRSGNSPLSFWRKILKDSTSIYKDIFSFKISITISRRNYKSCHSIVFKTIYIGQYALLSRYRAMQYVLHFHLALRFNTEIHNHKDASAHRGLLHPDPDEASLLDPLGGRSHFVPKPVTWPNSKYYRSAYVAVGNITF